MSDNSPYYKKEKVSLEGIYVPEEMKHIFVAQKMAASVLELSLE